MDTGQLTAVFDHVRKAVWRNSLPGKIESMVTNAVKSANSSKSEDLPAILEETQRLELQMRQAEAQAKVAQEIAIARRIEDALEVTLEEYYEYAADGTLGVQGAEAGFTIGATASGKRICKRIYKFSGRQINDLDEVKD